MYIPQGDRRMVVTPQLALRVAILGGIALVLFAVIFFRLWYLQVLSGDKYLAEANDNRVREVKVEAPRGRDRGPQRHGAGRQPPRARRAGAARAAAGGPVRAGPAMTRRLAHVLNRNPRAVRRKIRQDARQLPFSPVTLKTDVGLTTVLYLQENQSRFPGRRGRAGLPAEVPAQADRRPPVRADRRGDREADRHAPLLGRGAGRPRRAVRHRAAVRPLPARAQRREPDPGRRARAAEG